jgi:hypothetical protein
VSGASYRCAWEQGKRRLVGHWVLLSRFGSNGMGPRVEEQCQNDTVQILFFFFYYYYYIFFFICGDPKMSYNKYDEKLNQDNDNQDEMGYILRTHSEEQKSNL